MAYSLSAPLKECEQRMKRRQLAAGTAIFVGLQLAAEGGGGGEGGSPVAPSAAAFLEAGLAAESESPAGHIGGAVHWRRPDLVAAFYTLGRLYRSMVRPFDRVHSAAATFMERFGVVGCRCCA